MPRAASVWLSEVKPADLRFRTHSAAPLDQAVIHPLLRSADFVRVLRTRTQANSVHFAVHHLPSVPSVSRPVASKRIGAPGAPIAPVATDLSTSPSDVGAVPSERSPAVDSSDASPPDALWFGAVVPKRHAKRSVTRSLLKRQIRNVVERHGAALACGLWVVRLRAPFDRKIFTSAASDQLKATAREELDLLLVAASRRAGRAA